MLHQPTCQKVYGRSVGSVASYGKPVLARNFQILNVLPSIRSEYYENKDESFMILLCISLFFPDSLNPVRRGGVTASVNGGALPGQAVEGRLQLDRLQIFEFK